jgi:DNA polymerase-3 subunit epsilon
MTVLFIFLAFFLFVIIIVSIGKYNDIKRIQKAKQEEESARLVRQESEKTRVEQEEKAKDKPIASSKPIDDEESDIEEKNEYIKKAENLIKNIATFENAKFIHGVINNTIAFNFTKEEVRNGHEDVYIFVTSFGKSKLIKIEDLKDINFEVSSKNSFPRLFYCILNINDEETPEFKLLLAVEDQGEAKNIYSEIKKMIGLSEAVLFAKGLKNGSIKIKAQVDEPRKETQRDKGKSLRKPPVDYVIIDIETTGLSPEHDEIIELSAVKVKNDEIVDQFTTLCCPETKISSFITKINGITNDMVKDAPKIKEALERYISFIGDSVIMGHNVNFDINFIYNNYIKLFEKKFTNDFFDTLKLARKVCTDLQHHKLSDLVEHYNIINEQAHRGLSDCIATHQVYLKLKNV